VGIVDASPKAVGDPGSHHIENWIKLGLGWDALDLDGVWRINVENKFP
jgi:hypothetical protein